MQAGEDVEVAPVLQRDALEHGAGEMPAAVAAVQPEPRAAHRRLAGQDPPVEVRQEQQPLRACGDRRGLGGQALEPFGGRDGVAAGVVLDELVAEQQPGEPSQQRAAGEIRERHPLPGHRAAHRDQRALVARRAGTRRRCPRGSPRCRRCRAAGRAARRRRRACPPRCPRARRRSASRPPARCPRRPRGVSSPITSVGSTIRGSARRRDARARPRAAPTTCPRAGRRGR